MFIDILNLANVYGLTDRKKIRVMVIILMTITMTMKISQLHQVHLNRIQLYLEQYLLMVNVLLVLPQLYQRRRDDRIRYFLSKQLLFCINFKKMYIYYYYTQLDIEKR